MKTKQNSIYHEIDVPLPAPLPPPPLLRPSWSYYEILRRFAVVYI